MPHEPSPTVAKKASAIPQIDPEKIEAPPIPGQPPKDEEYKGSYIQTATGEPFALATLDLKSSVNGKTHFAKNSAHFWNGTEDEFKLAFEKK